MIGIRDIDGLPLRAILNNAKTAIDASALPIMQQRPLCWCIST